MSGVLGRWTGKCCDTRVMNNNNMLIGPEVLKELQKTDEYKAAIEHGWYIGYAGHPEDVDYQKFQEACVVMKDMEIKDNGDVFGIFDLVDTPVGRVLKAFIDAGVEFGISIRAFGDVDYQGNVSPQDFVFRGFDVVTFPAYNDCIPQYKAVTASTDVRKQQKYKILASTIVDNIEKISRPETLEVFRDQLNEDSDEYKLIDTKLEGVLDTEEPKVTPEETTSEPTVEDLVDEIAFLNKKLEAMTQLYLDTFNNSKELDQELQDCKLEVVDIQSSTQRKLHAMKRIVASQTDQILKQLEESENRNKILSSTNTKLKNNIHEKIVATKDLESQLYKEEKENKTLRHKIQANSSAIEDLRSENARLIEANTQIKNSDNSKELKSKLELAEKNNLIYKQKIETNTKILASKDSKISELESRLAETVGKNEKLVQGSSNRDAQLEKLRRDIQASENIIAEYQQAYADMCAGAIGVHLTNIPITARTSVSELKDYIYGSTAINRSYGEAKLEPIEFVSSIDGEDMATL